MPALRPSASGSRVVLLLQAARGRGETIGLPAHLKVRSRSKRNIQPFGGLRCHERRKGNETSGTYSRTTGKGKSIGLRLLSSALPDPASGRCRRCLFAPLHDGEGAPGTFFHEAHQGGSLEHQGAHEGDEGAGIFRRREGAVGQAGGTEGRMEEAGPGKDGRRRGADETSRPHPVNRLSYPASFKSSWDEPSRSTASKSRGVISSLTKQEERYRSMRFRPDSFAL